MQRDTLSVQLISLFSAISLISIISLVPSDNLITYALEEGNTNNSDCSAAIDQEMKAQNNAIDKDRAISLATSSPDFKTHIQDFSYIFNSIFSEGSFDPVTCSNYRTDTVNVVFSVNDPASGNYLKYVVVTEDPALMKVMNITDQVGNGHYGSGSINPTYPVATNARQMISDEEMKRVQEAQNQTNNTMYMIGIGAAIAGGVAFITLRKVKRNS